VSTAIAAKSGLRRQLVPVNASALKAAVTVILAELVTAPRPQVFICRLQTAFRSSRWRGAGTGRPYRSGINLRAITYRLDRPVACVRRWLNRSLSVKELGHCTSVRYGAAVTGRPVPEPAGHPPRWSIGGLPWRYAPPAMGPGPIMAGT
jgi:hypothetical protein